METKTRLGLHSLCSHLDAPGQKCVNIWYCFGIVIPHQKAHFWTGVIIADPVTLKHIQKKSIKADFLYSKFKHWMLLFSKRKHYLMVIKEMTEFWDCKLLYASTILTRICYETCVPEFKARGAVNPIEIRLVSILYANMWNEKFQHH